MLVSSQLARLGRSTLNIITRRRATDIEHGTDVRRIGPFKAVFASRTKVLLVGDGTLGTAALRITQSRAAFASLIEETVRPAGPYSTASAGLPIEDRTVGDGWHEQ